MFTHEEFRIQTVVEPTRATFEAGKGSHLRVKLNGKSSILPMHTADLKRGLVEGIKKQLGLK